MREKSLLCQNIINARLDFFLRLLWSSHWTVICGYMSLCYCCLPSAVDFGDGQPPWQTSLLRLYHMLVFLVFTPAEDADCLFLGTGSSLLLQAELLENSARQMSFPFIDQTDFPPSILLLLSGITQVKFISPLPGQFITYLKVYLMVFLNFPFSRISNLPFSSSTVFWLGPLFASFKVIISAYNYMFIRVCDYLISVGVVCAACQIFLSLCFP